MTEVLDGTLDAHSRRDLLTMTPDQVAGRHHDHEMAGYATPPDRWRVGVLPGGEPVGFVIAARNAHHAIIAYIRVRPAHRGHCYIDALPAEGTRVLAAQSVPRVRATTDVGNTPMAAAFARAGYVNFGQEIHYHWTRSLMAHGARRTRRTPFPSAAAGYATHTVRITRRRRRRRARWVAARKPGRAEQRRRAAFGA